MTFVVLVAVQIVMPAWVRPYLITPERVEVIITQDNLATYVDADGPIRRFQVSIDQPGAWVLSNDGHLRRPQRAAGRVLLPPHPPQLSRRRAVRR